jgi:hypothetical protein
MKGAIYSRFARTLALPGSECASTDKQRDASIDDQVRECERVSSRWGNFQLSVGYSCANGPSQQDLLRLSLLVLVIDVDGVLFRRPSLFQRPELYEFPKRLACRKIRRICRRRALPKHERHFGLGRFRRGEVPQVAVLAEF